MHLRVSRICHAVFDEGDGISQRGHERLAS
jgi:hypothetical protein